MDASALLDVDAIARLWARDGSLFTQDPEKAAEEAGWMGWVGLGPRASASAPALADAADAVARAGITDIVLLGMGGSSLAPLVLSEVIGPSGDWPALHVMDTTSPFMVQRLMQRLRPETTIFVVSSKSGSTIEPLSLYAIFRAWSEATLPGSGMHFAAVTDPESPLEALAEKERFGAVFHGLPDVGGRFSALSVFGTVPAAFIGIDVERLAKSAMAMEEACRVEDEDNPALQLAVWMADSLEGGHDKLTFLASERLAPFGLWVEQLVAESTGKEGKGIVPVLERPPFDASAYGEDRMVFVMRAEEDTSLAEFASHIRPEIPCLEVVVRDPYEVGAEFVRWECAVALTGGLMHIDPFNQPNVAEAKDATSAILAGTLTAPEAQMRVGDIAVTTNLSAELPAGVRSLSPAIDALLEGAGPGDYFAVLAYLPDDRELFGPLEEALSVLSASRKLACCLELGPRYLHSTGQLHKAGPAEGRFLIITSRGDPDLAIPGKPFTLGQLMRAQAEGDFVTLARRGLPVVRLDLPQPAHGPVRLIAETLRGARTAG